MRGPCNRPCRLVTVILPGCCAMLFFCLWRASHSLFPGFR